jgi:hypothetical protein
MTPTAKRIIPKWRVELTRNELLRAPVSKVEMGFRSRCKVRFRNLNPRAQRALNPCAVRWFDGACARGGELSSCGGSRLVLSGSHELTRRLWWNWWHCKNRAQRAAYRFTGGPIKEVFELSPREIVKLKENSEARCAEFTCPVCRGSGSFSGDTQDALDGLLEELCP